MGTVRQPLKHASETQHAVATGGGSHYPVDWLQAFSEVQARLKGQDLRQLEDHSAAPVSGHCFTAHCPVGGGHPARFFAT